MINNKSDSVKTNVDLLIHITRFARGHQKSSPKEIYLVTFDRCYTEIPKNNLQVIIFFLNKI